MAGTARRSARRAPPPRRKVQRAIGLVGIGVFGVGLTGLLTLVGLFWYYGRTLPPTQDLLRTWRPPQTTRRT